MAYTKTAQVFFTLFLLSALCIVQSSKILIFVPGFTDGQIKLFVQLGDLLTNAGCNVTLFRPQYNLDVHEHHSKSTDVEEVRYTIVDNPNTYRQWRHEISQMVYNESKTNLWSVISYGLDGRQKFALEGCERILSDSNFLTKLKTELFDLAVVDSEDACAFGLVQVLAIPTYTAVTSGILNDYVAQTVHIPSPISYVPNSLTPFSDRMTLSQRVQNLAAHGLTAIVFRKSIIEPTTALFRKRFGKEFPDLGKLISETPIIFVNDEELIDFPRPILSKTVYIGGFSTEEARPLSGSWKKLVDKATDGVVLISFGNVVKASEMPPKWKTAIMNACSKFPTHTFILKYEEDLDTTGTNVTNLKTAPWVPQERLLAHPKVKAFVTEGGLNSVLESAKHGVPMVIVPLFGDQIGNRWRAEGRGIAIGIAKKKFKSRRLVVALEQILTNETYKQNAERLSRMIKTKPVKPVQLVVGWIEFLAEYKTLPNLQPASFGLSLLQYLLLDALLIVLFIMAIIGFIVYRISYCYYWRCFETSFREKTE